MSNDNPWQDYDEDAIKSYYEAFGETIEKAQECFRKHDFYYDYADDQRAWNNGVIESAEILNLLIKLPRAESLALIEDYVPEELKETWIKRLPPKP